jgi:hypothetical protein
VDNMLTSTIIPGPKKAKDINSFLRPLVDELIALENGQVTAVDGDTGKEFVLRAHVLIVTGDGPATADAMGMKSPGNAFRPCRMCEIEGVRRTDVRKSPYYVPHTDYPFERPPIRTRLRADIELVEEANDDESRKVTGIKGKSELLRLRSIHFPRSFPGDIMHCVLQNVTPMLFQLWNRTKLTIDDKNTSNPTAHQDGSGLPSYYLEKDDLDSIGEALAQSRATIPLSLGHAPRRIDNHYKGFKAAEWKAWLIHYGTPLLWQHLHETYLANFRDLGTFYRLATAPVVSCDDVSQIASIARNFVRRYEKIYYRNEQERLPVCTINIHSILHFADWITDCGPACYSWQFSMERFCGVIKPMARSKSKLDASIANAVILVEHLNHLQFVHFDFANPNTIVLEELSYPRLANPVDLETTTQQLLRLHQVRRCKQIQSLQHYKRCHLSRDTTIGSRKSQVDSETNRDDHRILYYSMQEEQKFGVVEFFATVTDEDSSDHWAYVATLTGVVRHRQERVIATQQEGPHAWIRVEQIAGLIGLIKEGTAQFHMIVSDQCLF